jgi:ABC-2 type transport system permease protein
VTDVGFGGAPSPTSIRMPDGKAGDRRPQTFLDVVASEWIKLRSLRATTITSATTILLAIGIGLLVSFFSKPTFYGDAATNSMGGLALGQLVVAILGVMAVSSEYASRTIQVSLMAVSHKTRFFLAKLLVITVVCFVLGELVAFGSFGIGQAILHARNGWTTAPLAQGIPPDQSGFVSASLGQPQVFRAVLGAGLYLTLLGMIGAALGFIVRSTAAGIVLSVSIVFVLPIILSIIDHAAKTHIEKYWPTEAGGQIFTITQGPDNTVMAPFSGFAVLIAFTAAVLVAGWYVLNRRDA